MIIIYSVLLDSSKMNYSNSNYQGTEQSYIYNDMLQHEGRDFPNSYCDNQFYELQKTQFKIEIQKVKFQGIKCFLQLSPDRFVIGALKKYIREAPIHQPSREQEQRPHPPNQVRRNHRRPRQNINQGVIIQPNDAGNINQNFNMLGFIHQVFGRNPIAPRQINFGHVRNLHIARHTRRIGYISSEQQNQMNNFNETILYLFYVDIQGNIINKIRYGVGNDYKISPYSPHQILLQINQKKPPLTRQNFQSKLTVAKLDLQTKKTIQIFKTREYKPKTSLYFPQTRYICVIERYNQTIIENISVRYFSCHVKETSVLPDYQYSFELNENEENFHFIRGNNRGLVIWYMKVLRLQNSYIQFYYKSNQSNRQQGAKRIVIQKPQIIKYQDYSIQSILQAGEKASKFILFISSKDRLYTFVYEVHEKMLREIYLPLCQLDKRLQIDLIFSYVTRIIINSCVYYVDNVIERVFCYDFFYDFLEDDTDQEQFVEYSNDFLNQVRYQNSTFQIRKSRIVKVELFASVFLLEQMIIDAYKEKVKSSLNNIMSEEIESSNGIVWVDTCHVADMDLIFQVMVLLGLTQK